MCHGRIEDLMLISTCVTLEARFVKLLEFGRFEAGHPFLTLRGRMLGTKLSMYDFVNGLTFVDPLACGALAL